MSQGEKSKNHVIWKNQRIGKPPHRAEFTLDYDKINRAVLSFSIDLKETHSRLDPDQGILINDQMVPNMKLPVNPKSQSLEALERGDLIVTSLLRYSQAGEQNTVEVNYLLGLLASKVAFAPGFKAGTISLEIMVYYPTEITVRREKEKYCMWNGESIPRDASVCPYCARSPPQGGLNPKKCNNCPTLLPHEALYCEVCGHKQAVVESGKSCVNCSSTLAANASFCSNCGTKQPDLLIATSEAIKGHCVSCGQELSAGAKFCAICGFKQP